MLSIRPSVFLHTHHCGCRFFFQTLILTLAVGCLAVGFSGSVLAQDNIGIFWDSAFTQDSAVTNTYPDILSGYLVLMNPSTDAGVLGWECCAEVDGPGQFLSWTLEGQAINVNSPPCFAVGIAPDPLPSDGDVLLATFQIMVTEPLPVTLSLRPDFQPSLPDHMSFIPGDNPGTLLPMTTISGQPEVAWINGHIPNLAVDPATLHFENTTLGTEVIQTVTVTNQGAIPGQLDIALTGDCTGFSLPGISGLVTVAVGETLEIDVAFAPESIEMVFCNLALGADLAEVQMVGSGEDLEISWEAPSELDFGAVGIGQTMTLPVTIRNTGEAAILIHPLIQFCNPTFTLLGINEPEYLWPGTQRTINVRFQPAEQDTYSCYLQLGAIVPPVHLTGVGVEPSISWEAPTSHDFGLVGVGLEEWFVFDVTNTGTLAFHINPVVMDPAQNFLLISGLPHLLFPGQSTTIRVAYHPLTPGPHSGSLYLGATVPAVFLQGEGDPRPEEWSVFPDTLDFGWLYVGSYRIETVQVYNPGGTFLDLDIHLADPDLGYQVTSGGGTFALGPGNHHEVVVRFQPQTSGYFETVLNMGPEITPIPVMGSGEYSGDACVIIPDTLIFGPVEVGSTQTLIYSVTNNGSLPLEITPTISSPEYLSSGQERILTAGQTAQFSVLFQPSSPGTHYATVDLGDQLCDPVILIGTATSSGWEWNNQVGIFFDPEFTTIEAQTGGSNEIVEGYLVLIEPSETSGVSAWELATHIDGDASWVSWDIEGQHINIGQDGEFIVAIGGSPLPYSPAVLLATFQILVAEPYPNMVNLELGPIQTPSVPGQMVWAPWHDHTMLIPMQPFTGESVVAGINWSPPVGIGRPAPLATLTGGSVSLQWDVPDDPGDGCHVYRRDETRHEMRLTDQPLVAFGSNLTFTDQPAGYAPGAVLYYSYTVVDHGTESGRSQETEIRLTGMPAITTQLLPNVPNPFNPQTEIRFELAMRQTARVAIYDVTGRLVKTLVDGPLEAGTHLRVWRGRDSSGRQVPSGAYYVRLVADGRMDHQKIMLLK